MIVFDTFDIGGKQSVQSSNSDYGAAIYLETCFTTQLSGVIFLKSCDVCAASETFDLL